MAQRLGNAKQLVSEALRYVGLAGVCSALDQVALPFARKQTIFNLRGTLMDAEHVLIVPPSVLSFAARNALVACVAQDPDQIILEFANRLGIFAVIDGFV
jgi:hypothetical protein